MYPCLLAEINKINIKQIQLIQQKDKTIAMLVIQFQKSMETKEKHFSSIKFSYCTEEFAKQKFWMCTVHTAPEKLWYIGNDWCGEGK